MAKKAQGKKAATEEVVVPKPVQDNVLKVKAVIRPMYSPEDGVVIPDEGGVLVKKGSWVQSQLDRGLLRVVE